jgi:homoserine O-acetyltransferase
MDYFDLVREYGTLSQAFVNVTCRFLVVSFTSDWLFTVGQSEDIVNALAADGKDVSYCNIDSPYGHDAFLLEPQTLGTILTGFIDANYNRITETPNDVEEVKAQPGRQQRRLDHVMRIRVDYELIESLIEPDSRVLDIGCGDGELLSRLIRDKNIRGEGIELEQDLVVHSVQRGLSVIHRDIERGLDQYATDSFDYAILSQTLQTVKDPEKVFKELLRVANKVIISFPNFGHYKCRLQLLFKGRAPVTRQLPFRWYDSPNIHCLSLKDFDRFCEELGAKVEKRIPLSKSRLTPVRIAPNLLATQAVYVTSKYNTTNCD